MSCEDNNTKGRFRVERGNRQGEKRKKRQQTLVSVIGNLVPKKQRQAKKENQ